MQDSKEQAKWQYGNTATFTGFDDTSKTLIDFVFVGPRGRGDWEVEGYSELPNRFEGGVYDSVHRAVVVDGVLTVMWGVLLGVMGWRYYSDINVIYWRA